MSPKSLVDSIGNAVEGEDLDDVIEALAFMLADSVAQYSNHIPNDELFLEGGSLYSQAYQFVCSTDSITSH